MGAVQMGVSVQKLTETGGRRTHPNATSQSYAFDERNRLRSAVVQARYDDGVNIYPYEFSRGV